MKLTEHLALERIFLGEDLPDKEDVLRFAAEKFHETGASVAGEALFACMMNREDVMPTAVGNGMAVPHGACPDLEEAAVLLLSLARPVEYGAMDGNPVDVVVAMVVPEQKRDLHLRLLACMARTLKNPDFGRLVRGAFDREQLLNDLVLMEQESDI